MHDLPAFVRARLDPAQRYGLRLTLFALVVVLVVVPFGFVLREVVDRGHLTVYDRAVAQNLHELVRHHPVVIGILQVLSFLGKPVWFYFLIGVAIVYLWIRKHVRLVVYLLTTALGGAAVDTAVKVLVARPRPRLDHPIATAFGKSFPSGHAFTATALYGALLLCFLPFLTAAVGRWAMGAYVLLVSAIAFSRLALGVHFLTDVLGGIVLGAAWLAASTAAFEIWRAERGRKPSEPLRQGVEPEAAR
jgi:undecaprenyl-diphosphatase